MPSLGLTPGTKIAGIYEIIEQIGVGGMGVVYKVREQVGAVTRIRALKTILPQHLENKAMRVRFREEAEKMCLLEHENILPVLLYNEEGGLPYLVMPFIEGQTLKDYLRHYIAEHGGGLPLAQVIEIGLQLVYGLEAAHGFINPATGRPQPIIHRDIKPANIMIRVEERGGQQQLKVLIMDFGIAKLKAEDDLEPANMTLTDIIGTVKYAAPEQVQRLKHVDPRADIYSLGMVLYEIYCGRHVFGQMGEYSVLMRLGQRDLQQNHAELPPSTPEPFRQLIDGSIAVDRERRFAKVSDLLPFMRQALEEEARRRLGEVRSAEARAIEARTAALQQRVEALAPQSLATADAMIERAAQAQNAGEFTEALTLFSKAVSALQQGVRQAELRSRRDNLESRLEAVAELRSAAVAAGAEQFAADDFARAERATVAARQILRGDHLAMQTAILGADRRPLVSAEDLGSVAGFLEEAEAAWRTAENGANVERARLDVAGKERELVELLFRARLAFERIPIGHRPAEVEGLLARIRSDLRRPRAAPNAMLTGLGECRVALESAIRLSEDALAGLVKEKCDAALRRVDAVAAGGLDVLDAEHRAERERLKALLESATPADAVQRLGTIEAVEQDLERLEAAIAEAARRRAVADREAEVRATTLRESAEVARAEAERHAASPRSGARQRAAEERWQRAEAEFRDRRWHEAEKAFDSAAEEFRAAAVAAKNDAAKPSAEEALERLRRASARVADLRGARADEAAENARLLQEASRAEPLVSRGEFAAAAPLLRDTAEAMERLAERIRGRQESERVTAELDEVRRQVSDTIEQAMALADAGVSWEGRPFLDDVAAAEEVAARGDGRAAIDLFREIHRSLTEEIAAARVRLEEARARDAAVRAKRDADAAAVKSRSLGERATADPTYARAIEELDRAEALLATGDYSSADRTFADATRTLAGLAHGIEAMVREERRNALATRAGTLRLELAELPDVRELRKPRKAAGTSLKKADELLRSGDDTGAETALADCAAILARVPSARPAPFAPAQPTWNVTRLAGTAALLAALVAGLWLWVQTRVIHWESTQRVSTARQTPNAPATAVPTARPTTISTVVPTVVATKPVPPTPLPAEPQALTLRSVSPPPDRTLKIAIGGQLSFEGILKSGDANDLEWKVDDNVVRRGASFRFDKERTREPGDHTIALVGRSGGEEAFRREWRVKIAAPPLQWANLQPGFDRVEGEPGQTFSFVAPLNGASPSELSYRWKVNGVDQQTQTSTLQLAAAEPGNYDVRVRADAPWERSAEHAWVLVVASAPRVLATPRLPPIEEVEAWVRSFCEAYERKDVSTLTALGQFKSEGQADAARDAFKSLHDFKVSCTKPSIAFEAEDKATVNFTRTDSFLDDQRRAHSGEIPYRDLPLRRVDGHWVKSE